MLQILTNRLTPPAMLRLIMTTLAAAAFGTAVNADIYKHVDEEGNVSYSDVSAGIEVESVEVDESTNVFDPNDSALDVESDFMQQRLEDKREREKQAQLLSAWRKELKEAQRELKSALAAQSQGVMAEEGDFIGSANGGARPSASYFQKLKDLDKRVDKARDGLKKVKKSKPSF